MSAVSLEPIDYGQLSLDLPPIPLNNVEWSDEDLYTLLEGTLRSQLHLFADSRLTESGRRELIDWVATPIRPQRVAVRKDPFSFQSCCYAAGVDPEEMQEQVLRLVAPDRIKALMNQ